jgi:hypothetical protein
MTSQIQITPELKARLDALAARRMSPLAIVILVLLLLPALYVLAIGPAHWLMDRGYISEWTFDAVYWEFIVVVKKSPSAQQIAVWYIDLWVKS